MNEYIIGAQIAAAVVLLACIAWFVRDIAGKCIARRRGMATQVQRAPVGSLAGLESKWSAK